MVEYEFLKAAGRIINSGQSRALILTGAIHDLFRMETTSQSSTTVEYTPLIGLLGTHWNIANKILIVYELNGPIRFMREGDQDKLRNAWLRWRTGWDSDQLAVESMLSSGRAQAEFDMMGRVFDTNLKEAIGNPTVALEVLRQMCLCSRMGTPNGEALCEDLIIIIEAADMLIPEGPIQNMSDADRHRIAIMRDWVSDPGFMNGDDAVVLLVESRSLLNDRVARLPQIVETPVPAPDEKERLAFIDWFMERQPEDRRPALWSTRDDLARFTAGLSIHALMQLLRGACHEGRAVTLRDAIDKVEVFIQSQLGEDVVEFKKPEHRLDAVIGFSQIKEYLRDELIPRFLAYGPEALPGAAVCGPIGGGKTFIFEALASELDMVVLVLKNVRSKWFGETDVIFERLRRVLDALSKVLIFVDEADTQFGGVGPEAHATERRLTGKIQAMMSDPRLRGRVIWLLMTARIHLLSPDIRRPGRVGDIIIPILDPEGEDRDEFIRWVARPALGRIPDDSEVETLRPLLTEYSSASFASLRSELKAKSIIKGAPLTLDEIKAVVENILPAAIGLTRRYQSLQALANCTRRRLLPDPNVDAAQRESWREEILALEAKGIH